MTCPKNWSGVVVPVPLASIQRFRLEHVQTSYPLVPVGFETDGKLKPADRLTYKAAKRLAKRSKFKTYRVDTGKLRRSV